MLKRAAHPGEILKDELAEIGVTPTELARQIDVGVTPTTATLILSMATHPGFKLLRKNAVPSPTRDPAAYRAEAEPSVRGL